MPVPTISQLQTLSNALKYKPPYCTGTMPMDRQDLILFYGKEKNAGKRLDFASVSDDELEHLIKCCDVATFGRNNEDVFDESYRKAGKLDAPYFSPKLEVQRTGLVDIIQDDLLEGSTVNKDIRIEMYKLNVYGKGSFFKAHKDTPRSENMFGTLVIFFPTDHEGGNLILRDDRKEWTFDCASAVKAHNGHCIAYAAFFGDVEHEVTEVTSGYRVTLTYNLYFEHTVFPSKVNLNDNSAELRAAFEKVLSDPTFLPDGGLLGFGLHREYALSKENKGRLEAIASCLKGTDEALMQACIAVGLEATPHLFYKIDGGKSVIVDVIPQLDDAHINEDHGGLSDYLRIKYNGAELGPSSSRSPLSPNDGPDATVYWVNKMSRFTTMKSTFTAYGNESSVDYAYGHVILVVDVGSYWDRKTLGQTESKHKRKYKDEGLSDEEE